MGGSVRVSELGALGEGVMSIVSLSAMLFMFDFGNSSVSRFSPYDSKWTSGAMSEMEVAVAVAVAVAAVTVAASGVDSLSRVVVFSVAFCAASSFI